MYGMYQVPVVASPYVSDTSLVHPLLACKDQETEPEVGSGDRHLPLSCLVDRVLGGE